jgi:uncharacterized UBP type Zn finger protein
MFYACTTPLLRESCQGCNRAKVSPIEEYSLTVTSDLEGMPNLGNTCYMNTVLRIITALCPDIFEIEYGEALTKEGKPLWTKLKTTKIMRLGKKLRYFMQLCFINGK